MTNNFKIRFQVRNCSNLTSIKEILRHEWNKQIIQSIIQWIPNIQNLIILFTTILQFNSNTKDLTIQECFFFFNSTPSIVCICWLKESKRGWLIYKLIYFLQYKPKYIARDLILLLSNFEIYNHNQWKEAYSKYNFIE